MQGIDANTIGVTDIGRALELVGEDNDGDFVMVALRPLAPPPTGPGLCGPGIERCESILESFDYSVDSGRALSTTATLLLRITDGQNFHTENDIDGARLRCSVRRYPRENTVDAAVSAQNQKVQVVKHCYEADYSNMEEDVMVDVFAEVHLDELTHTSNDILLQSILAQCDAELIPGAVSSVTQETADDTAHRLCKPRPVLAALKQLRAYANFMFSKAGLVLA
jgi:hypothetical protein